MKRQFGYTLVEILIGIVGFVIIPAAVIGWIWNIIKLVAMVADPITGMLIARVVGIFIPPLGAVMGYL